MSRTDHAAKARNWLEMAADGAPASYSGAVADALAAQTHATLALVEQQRITNLIALATGQHTFEGISRRASDTAHAALVSDPNGDLRPSIAAALGIEVQAMTGNARKQVPAAPAAPDTDRLLVLIRDLADPDDCWFDHHGGCQAHGYLSLKPGEMCPHAEAKQVLAAAAAHEQIAHTRKDADQT